MPTSGSGSATAAVSSGYPTADDLEDFLVAAGFTLSAAMEGQLEAMVNAAIADFENATDRKPMLAPADDATKRFDPPQTWRNGSAALFLKRDLAAITSVQYQPTGATAETLTVDEDYELEPYDAPDEDRPYTRIRFLTRRWTAHMVGSQRGAIRVTGRWGYGTTLPHDAWLSMLARGAWRLFTQLAQAETGGRLAYKDDEVDESFGVETWTRLRDGWAAQFDSAVMTYRRWDL